MTASELAIYNGSEDAPHPIYISIQSTIFDVTKGKKFYQKASEVQSKYMML